MGYLVASILIRSISWCLMAFKTIYLPLTSWIGKTTHYNELWSLDMYLHFWGKNCACSRCNAHAPTQVGSPHYAWRIVAWNSILVNTGLQPKGQSQFPRLLAASSKHAPSFSLSYVCWDTNTISIFGTWAKKVAHLCSGMWMYSVKESLIQYDQLFWNTWPIKTITMSYNLDTAVNHLLYKNAVLKTYHIQRNCKQGEPLGLVAYIHAGCKLQTSHWD